MAIRLDGVSDGNFRITGQSALGMVGAGGIGYWIAGDVVSGVGDDQACLECHKTSDVVHRIADLVDQDRVGDWFAVDRVAITGPGNSGTVSALT